MIFVTGDTHGDVRRFKEDIFTEQKEMTKKDFVVILGDFGLIWDYKGENKREKDWLDWLEAKSFTTLFLDGNHENFDRLMAYKTSKWHGGKVHQIRPSVIHLMRGQVYKIDGQKVFAFGGAASHDIEGLATEEDLERDYAAGVIHKKAPGSLNDEEKALLKRVEDAGKFTRIEHVSWWKEEMPSKEEKDEGIKNLEAAGWKVDFVFTHCLPASTVALMSHGAYKPDHATTYLEDIRQKLEFRHWLSGHYHENKNINDREHILYEQIIRIA